MLDRLDPLLTSWRWPTIALVSAGVMLAIAHAFETFALMLPCPLCLRQREIYWAVMAMAATTLLLWRMRPNPRFLRAIDVMLGLVFLTGAVVAIYHAGVEWRLWPAPAGCVGAPVDISAFDPARLDEPQGTVSCLDAPWVMLGLSMAGWNAIASLILAVISFRAATLNRREPISSAE